MTTATNTYEARARARKAERLADQVDLEGLRPAALRDPDLINWNRVTDLVGDRPPSEATIATAIGILEARSAPFDWRIFDGD